MGYTHNRFDTQVISAYMKMPSGYEFNCKQMTLSFFNDYGFDTSEYLYMEERRPPTYTETTGVRVNVVLPSECVVCTREIKQICKRFREFLREQRWIQQVYKEDYDLVVMWGQTTIKVGEKNYDEDY